MATVYRATYEGAFGLQRAVAVKVFDVVASDEHDAVLEALANAARRAACLRHPNVVRVEDFGLASAAQPYTIQELVEGRTLAAFATRLNRAGGRFPPDIALFVACEVADALAAARLASTPEGVRLGIFHGELSTSDVLLSWHGEVKVADFGVSAAARAASSVRSVRAFARRIRALSPEVARGQTGDARSDVFSLGVMLREMLVGPRFPSFVTDTEALSWARDGIVHQSLFERRLAPPLQTILTRALEREPSRRYPHAGAMAYELRKVALAMGVGDGRAFLRAALARAFGDGGADGHEDEVTGEMRVPASRPSGVVDRFARLRGEDDGSLEPDVEEGLESGTVLVANASALDEADEDDDDDEDDDAGRG
jgi:serine/threonine protein kinase